MYQVVSTCNYDSETVDEERVSPFLRSEEIAEKVATLFNEDAGERPSKFFVVKPHTYKLYRFEP